MSKVDIFLSTDDFVDFENDEYRKVRMFPIDCKHYLNYPSKGMKASEKRSFSIS